MKKMVKKVLPLLIVPALMISCSKKNEVAETVPETETPASEIVAEPEVTESEQLEVVEAKIEEPSNYDDEVIQDDTPLKEVSDEKRIFLEVSVNDDNVNLRSGPGTNFEVDSQVKKGDVLYVMGFDQHRVKVDGTTGYWVQVYNEANGYCYPSWIFSKFIDMNRSLKVNKVEYASKTENDNGIVEHLVLKFTKTRTGETVEKTVYYPHNCGEYYSFTWNTEDSDFDFADPVGTFIWYPNTNEVAHVSSYGEGKESAWTMPTPDGKYLLTDSGTGAGPRWINVRDLKTLERVYGGSYWRDVDYKDGKIKVVKIYGKSADDEVTPEDAEVQNFVATTPLPEEYAGIKYGIGVLKIFEHDLATGNEVLTGFQYFLGD